MAELGLGQSGFESTLGAPYKFLIVEEQEQLDFETVGM